MTNRAQRFARIHHIRARLLDVADVERSRLRSSIATNRKTVDAVREQSTQACISAGGAAFSWRNQQALLRIADFRQTQLAVEHVDLKLASEQAERKCAEAMLAREQAARLMERAKREHEVEQGRRDQAALDDAFAIAHTRKKSPSRL